MPINNILILSENPEIRSIVPARTGKGMSQRAPTLGGVVEGQLLGDLVGLRGIEMPRLPDCGPAAGAAEWTK